MHLYRSVYTLVGDGEISPRVLVHYVGLDDEPENSVSEPLCKEEKTLDFEGFSGCESWSQENDSEDTITVLNRDGLSIMGECFLFCVGIKSSLFNNFIFIIC